MKTSKGKTVNHQGKPWVVDKVITQGRTDNNHKKRAYVRAFPMCGKQVLYRSGKIIGDDWE